MDFQRSTSGRKLNLTPLIDLVFLLLVFFMLTTSFSGLQGITLSFAGPGTSAASPDKNRILVRAESSGQVALNNTLFTLASFREALRKLLAENKSQTILVTSGEEATVQNLVNVLDQIDRAGGTNVTLTE